MAFLEFIVCECFFFLTFSFVMVVLDGSYFNWLYFLGGCGLSFVCWLFPMYAYVILCCFTMCVLCVLLMYSVCLCLLFCHYLCYVSYLYL